MEHLANWIRDRHIKSGETIFWEKVIPFENELSDTKELEFSTKESCYDRSIGISKAIFLAGKALRNHSLKEFALNSFRSLITNSQNDWNLIGPTFRHGISGLLLVTQQMAHETKASDLSEKVLFFKETLFEFYRPDYTFGFRDCNFEGGKVEVEHVGLLDGVSGILLTLLSLEGLSSWWHAPFLIGDGS